MATGFILAACAAITWGLVYFIDQEVLLRISPLVLLFSHAIVTAIIIAPFVLLQRSGLSAITSLAPGHRLPLVISLLLTPVAGFLIYAAISRVGASYASIIEIAYPFFVVLFGAILGGEVPTPSLLVGGALVFLGVAIVTQAA